MRLFLRWCVTRSLLFFFFNDTATTEIYTLSLHDALPISNAFFFAGVIGLYKLLRLNGGAAVGLFIGYSVFSAVEEANGRDRKSTRLNSSHTVISYAVFCLKKKKKYHSSSTA